MTTTLNLISIIILLFAACIVVMNWSCVIANMRNKKRGIDKHRSTVSLVSLVLAVVAFQASPLPDKTWMFLIPLLDIGNWTILLFPVVLIKEMIRKRNTKPGDPGEGG